MSEIGNKYNDKSSTLETQGIEARDYQVNIANKCTSGKSLVVLPTGLGKTIIAVLVSNKILKLFPLNSKIIVLAPTRPLINQHYETFLKFLQVPKDRFAILTGKIPPEKRVDMFDHHQILFFTPQTLRNDLINRKYTLKDTALIIFDEAHHASGDYPYTMIADVFLEHNPDGISLALTASPGASKKKINLLCENLHIPLENIHIRTRKDADVKTYVKPMDIYKIGVNLTSLMSELYELLIIILEERLQYLSQLNFIETKGDPLHKKVIRKDLLRLNAELVRLVNSEGDKTGVYSALSINAQALKIYHALELVEQQGLDVLLNYLEKLNKDAKKNNSSKATRILATDSRMRKVFLELKKNKDYTPENLVHPKFPVLNKIISDELRQKPSSRILVFVKLRNSVKNIVNRLINQEEIRPVRFVGQATKSQDDKGLSQKRQVEILEQFKQGIYNVLVSTNVGEEGLDIAECDLVIFYDVVASEIRLIQRKGRTARHRKGKVVILYCKDTHDEIYLQIALSKLKRMNVTLKNPKQLQSSQTPFPSRGEIESHYQEEIRHEFLVPTEKIHVTRKHQTRLQGFIGGDKIPTKNFHQVPIKLGKQLPMKFGIRGKLKRDNILFEITDSDLHVIIHNKVLIQIFNPKNLIQGEFLSKVDDFSQICSLLLIIFDFIDYEEETRGEKRDLKQELQKICKREKIHFISIDNEEELYFMLKNVLENPPEENE